MEVFQWDLERHGHRKKSEMEMEWYSREVANAV